MKKILFSVVLLFAAVCTYAQGEIGKWSVTPKVGFNIATMTNADDSDPRFGLAVGAEAEYQANEVLGISVGALYSQQGVKGDFYVDDGEYDVKGDATVKMDYINVPILANFYVAKGLAVKIGLQPGFKVNAKAKLSANGTSTEFDLDDLFKAGESDADVKSVDLAIPVGLSYEYSNIKFDARYNWGVTKAITADGESTRNSVFQFTIGYRFSL